MIFLLNHMLTYCITVELGKIVLKCKYRVGIEQLFDNPYCLHRSCIGSNLSRGATRDIGSPTLLSTEDFKH